MFSYCTKSKITWVMRGCHELFTVQGAANQTDEVHHPGRAPWSCLQECNYGCSVHTISLKEYFSRNYYSYLPFLFYFFLLWSFPPSFHQCWHMASFSSAGWEVLSILPRVVSIFCFTKLFYKAQIQTTSKNFFLFWKQTPLSVNQMTLPSPLTVDNKSRVWQKAEELYNLHISSVMPTHIITQRTNDPKVIPTLGSTISSTHHTAAISASNLIRNILQTLDVSTQIMLG